MACRSRFWLGGSGALVWTLGAVRAWGQASGAFPLDPPPAPAPPPAASPAPAAPPPAAPAAATPPAAAAPAAAPAPAPAAAPVPAPAPAPAPAAPPAAAPPAPAPTPAPYEPPPPAPPRRDTSSVPPFSLRLDPFNWILEGQLGVEVEVGVLSWLSVEAVPVFVTAERPPWLNLFNGDARVYQHSDGWGPMSGASFGVAFWPKKLFKGYAIRVGLMDQALRYETRDDLQNVVDSVSHTKRELYAMLGTMERWGPFTMAGGFGLGYDLNNETRCYHEPSSGSRSFNRANFRSGDCSAIQVGVPVDPNGVAPVAITPFTYPWEILARFSLGVTID